MTNDHRSDLHKMWGDEIHQARTRAGLSLSKLAARVGWSYTALRLVENGQVGDSRGGSNFTLPARHVPRSVIDQIIAACTKAPDRA